ncbi:class I SAM-dependent methyltransferase [Pedobacter sp. AW31-3R]|uniref:class I SAM-dependent methyltransferase n=1 Tax=Pedobacter sp. AW31-3R TaxID=3445781 RepID=UPI003FA163BB
MLNNYDKIANYYDVLSRMVFFKSQVNAQVRQLPYIPENSRVLIAGGGTGWILDEIAKVHPTGLHITYVEISSKMLSLSKKRKIGGNKVDFVRSSIEDFRHVEKYNVIITAFLFDNFLEPRIKLVFDQLHSHMAKNGIWLFTDFHDGQKDRKNWRFFLLKTMYLFFRNIAQVEARSLIQMESLFKQAGYTVLTEAYYYKRFIKSTVYCVQDGSAEHVHEPE